MSAGEHKAILIVEDEEKMAELLATRFDAMGFQTHAEATGAGALVFAAEHRPDLVILDLRLPDIGGYEVCKQLRKIFHPWEVPILMLTGMDKPIDELRGFAHGADAYLTKPFDQGELTQTVSLLLGEATLR